MSYKALYRQWRPERFSDMVGQEHITRTLQNQIHTGRIAHAYLFCGSRGTGKTTTAKIFARAINCQSPLNGDPCDSCDVCKKLSSENVMDIIEIDAASNNGVDEIRDLREKAKFPPTVGRYKVYIIDEVHMLSTGAFNALLKTLEEPPAHVVFILATTEPQRLPATILSRCQRYDFHRISLEDIVQYLKKIAHETGVHFEEQGLKAIARAAEGGMRDALSIMDQCISFCGDEVSYQDVLRVLGTADQSFYFEVAGEILEGNVPGVLRAVDRLIEEGRDIGVFVRDLVLHFRNLLMVKVCGDVSEMLDVTQDTLEEYKVQSQGASRERMIRAIDRLASLESELKWSSQPRILLEVALIKICRPERDDSTEALLERIARLEEAVKNGIVPAGPSDAVRTAQTRAFAKAPAVIPEKTQGAAPNPVTDVPSTQEKAPVAPKDPAKAWQEILKILKKEKMGIYTMISEGAFRGIKSNVLTVTFPETGAFYAMALEKEDNRKCVEEAVTRVIGQEMRVKYRVGEQEDPSAEPEVDQGQLVIERAIEVFGKDRVEIAEED